MKSESLFLQKMQKGPVLLFPFRYNADWMLSALPHFLRSNRISALCRKISSQALSVPPNTDKTHLFLLRMIQNSTAEGYCRLNLRFHEQDSMAKRLCNLCFYQNKAAGERFRENQTAHLNNRSASFPVREDTLVYSGQAVHLHNKNRIMTASQWKDCRRYASRSEISCRVHRRFRGAVSKTHAVRESFLIARNHPRPHPWSRCMNETDSRMKTERSVHPDKLRRWKRNGYIFPLRRGSDCRLLLGNRPHGTEHLSPDCRHAYTMPVPAEQSTLPDRNHIRVHFRQEPAKSRYKNLFPAHVPVLHVSAFRVFFSDRDIPDNQTSSQTRATFSSSVRE